MLSNLKKNAKNSKDNTSLHNITRSDINDAETYKNSIKRLDGAFCENS